MGWIFHVSSAENRRSIEQHGLLREPGRGKSGRDSVHFMYHNDNSPGYVRMAEGTTAPRQYRHPIYCVLLPRIAHDFQLFLSQNGAVLIYDDIPPEYLKIVDQLPTIAMNILRPGRAHMLSSTVTGGTWPEDVTAWAFMGQWDRKFLKTMVDQFLVCLCQNQRSLTPSLNRSMDFFQEALTRERNLRKMMNQ